jgi:hypothetical protein
MKKLTVLLLLLLLVSCNEERKQEVMLYFSLNDFISSQFEYLSKNPPAEFKKILSLNGKQEHATSGADELERLAELIRKTDINKPAYAGSYLIEENTDTFKNQNIKQVSYLAKEGENVAVKELNLLYIDDVPVRIFITKANDNILYHTNETISIELKEGIISKITISNYQKILFLNPRDSKLEYWL